MEAAEVGVRGVADDVIMEGFQEGAVGNDEDAGVGFGGVAREEVVQEGLRAGEDGLDGLETVDVGILADVKVVDAEIIPVDNLPFEVTVATFDEEIVIYNIRAVVSNNLGGFLRAAKRRGVDIVKLETFGGDTVFQGFTKAMPVAFSSMSATPWACLPMFQSVLPWRTR